ncbi:guanine nucleotide-binding protein subunit beta-like protein 1 [Danaus plexippus]|uniref:Receptor for activated C kinase n=1 Tax=Danaus plexippus plexippus TaxID=278856 RepID=A0A212EW89_DANPL|nr:guanine nucleotide-binding protein subunit beta-like protein 1 [Danaus plexippus]OWR45768.1 putative receptor for activated C kinase [Danaus plexippus plexippus]
MALLPPDPVFTIRNVDNSPVYSLAFSFLPGGLERLLAGSKNGYVYAYNLQTNRVQQKIKVGQAPILHLIHTDNQLITQEKGGKFKIFNLTNSGYKEEQIIDIDYPGFCRFVANTELETLYVPDGDARIQIYNFSGEKLGILKPDDNSPKLGETMCMKLIEFPNDKPCLLVGYEAGWLLLWDLNTSQCIGKMQTKECPMSVDFHIEQQRGIIGNASDVIQIFSISKKDFSLTHKMDVGIKNPGINKVSTRSDGRVFASGGWDGHIRIFSWFSLRQLVVLTEHRQAVQEVVYSDQKVSYWNANIMAAGGLDGAITLWDLYNTKK